MTVIISALAYINLMSWCIPVVRLDMNYQGSRDVIMWGVKMWEYEGEDVRIQQLSEIWAAQICIMEGQQKSAGPIFSPSVTRATSCVVLKLKDLEKVFIVFSLSQRWDSFQLT